jgi:SAM-dependent methyltransferase
VDDNGDDLRPRLYSDLAPWWPRISAPEDYAEEAALYRRLMEAAAGVPLRSMLELGCGGGNNASHLKAHYTLTLVDRSPEMLAVSRALNPDCRHLVGDMRNLRLGREFDAVFIHDAVTYLTTLSDVHAALATAAVHCRRGGVVLVAPDHLRETFRPDTSHGGNDGPDGRAARYLEWVHEPSPGASEAAVDYVFVLRDDEQVEVVHDRHRVGIFSRDEWLGAFSAAGLRATSAPFEHSEVPPGTTEVFVGTR